MFLPIARSVPPEILEALRRQIRVARGVLDNAMPEILLDCPGVLSVVRELVSGSMTQHVWVDGELDARVPARAS
jgi:hypothetical protein